MIKITAIISSPEQTGSSEILLDAFLCGISETKKDIEIKTYDLKNIDFEFHCHNCKSPRKNEVQFKNLIEDIEISQALIIASPTYNFSVPAKLKNLIDRMGFIALDYKNPNKIEQPTGKLDHLKTYFIITGGTPNLIKKLIFPLFPDFWLQAVFWYYGAKRGGSIYTGNLTFINPAKSRPKLIRKLKKLGDKFCNKIKVIK